MSLCLFTPCAARFARCFRSLSCHFHTLLPFTCADDSCLSLLHEGVSMVVNSARYRLSFERGPRHNPSFLAGVFFLTRLRASFSAGTPVDRSTSLVEPDCSLSCLHLFWHRFIGCCSRLFIAWTDVLVFLHFGFVRPAFEVKTECGAPSCNSWCRSDNLSRYLRTL